jgi:hypothetical protein
VSGSTPGRGKRSRAPSRPVAWCSGRVKTPARPAATAVGANSGKRSSFARSGATTGFPDSYASRPGPSPSCVCSCSHRIVGSDDAAMYCAANPGEMRVAAAPATGSTSTTRSTKVSRIPWIGKSPLRATVRSRSTAGSCSSWTTSPQTSVLQRPRGPGGTYFREKRSRVP